MKRTLVIGNGFDLDAGLKTSYREFSESRFWPFKDFGLIDDSETLGYYLNMKSQLETWFDVEEAIFEYARKDKKRILKNGLDLYELDKKHFKLLKEKLIMFLKDAEDMFEPKEGSSAPQVLNAFINGKGEKAIYSFNYTDLSWIAQRYNLFWDKSLPCNYIHGSLALREIILGVGDKREIDDHYFDFYKTSSPAYQSHRIIPDLIESDEIIIFGHSFGLNDYPYFLPFFQEVTSYNGYSSYHRKKISIITLSEKSALEIKRHLRELTQAETTLLYNLNDFKIICTGVISGKKEIAELVDSLS